MILFLDISRVIFQVFLRLFDPCLNEKQKCCNNSCHVDCLLLSCDFSGRCGESDCLGLFLSVSSMISGSTLSCNINSDELQAPVISMNSSTQKSSGRWNQPQKNHLW